MIAAAFDYERATSIDDALTKLQAAGGGGKLIAGGHSLVPLMKLRLAEPTVLIDIARVPGLAGVREHDHGLEVGALTTHHEVATSAILGSRCPAVAETARLIGDPQVRNRGTVGGSLVHADPAADYPAIMLALDATVHAIGPAGRRAIRMQDFVQGVFTVDLAADELVTHVTFTPSLAAAYAKLAQRASRFAVVGVAAALDVSDGVIRSARVALTGAASYPRRLTAVEAALGGQPAAADAIAAAAALAGDGIEDLNDDLHASADYRRAMIPVCARRALAAAAARAGL